VLTNFIGSTQDAITSLDQIKRTPLLFAYQAHLRMTLWYEYSSLVPTLGVHQGETSAVGYISSSFLHVFLS